MKPEEVVDMFDKNLAKVNVDREAQAHIQQIIIMVRKKVLDSAANANKKDKKGKDDS